MSNIWDRVKNGSSMLLKDTTAGVKTTNHIFCTAFIEGSEKCVCPKHARKEEPVAPVKEIKVDDVKEDM